MLEPPRCMSRARGGQARLRVDDNILIGLLTEAIVSLGPGSLPGDRLEFPSQWASPVTSTARRGG